VSFEASLPRLALAPAKVNLGLFVGPPRSDGRHELVSVMQSVSLADEVIFEAGRPGADRDEIRAPAAAGPAASNLAAIAVSEFRRATGWDAPPLRVRLTKRIPVAAGMGGGSADAGAALRLACEVSGLGDADLLAGIARGLGADVPAQVRPGRCLARGAGEVLEELPAPRAELGVLVLPSEDSLSTAAVYAEADRIGVARSPAELVSLGAALSEALVGGAVLPDAAELLHNDLQSAAISLCPGVEAVLDDARGAGADIALVSGSGPTVIGLFGGEDGPARAARAATALAMRTPAPIAARSVDAAFGRPRPA
jgi:4-diphosphocytidyl-2-C-methyl-D-erythritol kinase